MFEARLALLALAVIPVSHPVPVPAKVAAVTIEDLIRFSDAVVVGKVERIEIIHRPREEFSPPENRGDLGADVPFANVSVSRVLKGPAELKRVIYLAAPTWTCDITTAEVGETVLLFLGDASQSELFDPPFRRRVRSTLPEGEWMEVLWSGRGRMPLRSLGGRVMLDPSGAEKLVGGVDHATCWVGDVVLPKDAPTVDGPEAEYSFIRSVPIPWLEERVRDCLKQQKEPWFKASVSEVRDGSRPWDLEVALDGSARLVIHEFDGDREVRFHVHSSRLPRITYELRYAHRVPPPQKIGSGSPMHGVRTLQVVAPEPTLDLSILSIDERWIGVADRYPSTRTVLEAWDLIRGSFDEPRCADHRVADAPWREDRR